MIAKAFCQMLSSMFGDRDDQQAPKSPPMVPPGVAPLTTGIRVEYALSTGPGNETVGTQLLWMTADQPGRPTKALRVLVLPN